mmetsp:Transcript_4452/g.14429  ORF Transcript_4452/g.14429 Transcript_4452/m.14429 type:complete len:317 (-) Transcript_4452:82-1032(-)
MDILCSFDSITAKGPMGISSPNASRRSALRDPSLTPDEIQALHDGVFECREQVMCKRRLDRMKGAAAHEVREVLLQGGNGFASTVVEDFESGSFYTDDGITVCLSGSITKWDPSADHGVWDPVCDAHDAFLRNENPENDAERLLRLYHLLVDSMDRGTALARVISALGMLSGHFAFVIYDHGRGTVLAARDGNGTNPLYWGSTDTEVLLISNRLDLLEDCDPTATEFPAGCVFISQGGVEAYEPGEHGFLMGHTCPFPGKLFSYINPRHHVHGVPRITSKGVLNGMVYRVDSQPTLYGEEGEDMTAPPSVSPLVAH